MAPYEEVGEPLKRISCLLLCILLCLLSPRAWGELPDPVERARQSVVQLYGIGTDSQTGKRSRWTGTGFAVGIAGEDSDVFLTNWHVATGSGSYADSQVELWILKDDARFDENRVPLEGSAIRCRVLITTDGYPDVAVVQALEPVTGYPALPLLSSRRVTDGTEVYALGFPGLQSVNASGPEDVNVTSGTLREHLTMTNAGCTRSVIHSAPIRHGFSGGPLVNEEGVVVAQNAYGFEPEVSTELFCAVYLDYGMELLDRLNIPYTTAEGPWVLAVWVANLLRRRYAIPALAALLLGVVSALLPPWRSLPGKAPAEPGRKRASRKEESLREE